MRPACGWWLGLLLVIAWLGSSCAGSGRRVGPSGAPGSGASGEVERKEGELTGDAGVGITVGDRGALPGLVALAIESVDDPQARASLLAAAVGHEVELVTLSLDRGLRESRDLAPWLRQVALAAVLSGGGLAGGRVIEEVVVRECCLRRGFMAATLDGVADGLGMGIAGPGLELPPLAIRRLEELRRHADAEVARAAERVISVVGRAAATDGP